MHYIHNQQLIWNFSVVNTSCRIFCTV